jgi:hypothetical protein|nr:MAG TPA: GcrA cell cycle regulator [Caudoviricetes sp.]
MKDIGFYDGWCALCISILRNVSPDQAFRLFETGVIYEKRKWSWEDIDDIQSYRDQGLSWKDIAEIFNMNKSGLIKNFDYWKKNKKRG